MLPSGFSNLVILAEGCLILHSIKYQKSIKEQNTTGWLAFSPFIRLASQFELHTQFDYYLIVVDQHVRQMIHSTILNRLRFGLLGVAVVRSKPDFWWIIQTKMLSYSFNNIVISIKPWPKHSKEKNEY